MRTVQAVRKQDEMKSILGRRVFGQEEPVSNGIREMRHFPMDGFQVSKV